MPAVVVLGARNLGGAILGRFLADGWSAAGVARSAETVAAVRARGAFGYAADVGVPHELAAALSQAQADLGGLDVVVNAVSVARPLPGEVFGGGPVADADLEAVRRWSLPVVENAFVFLSESARALRDHGGGGTLVQITSASSRRAAPGMGLWSAGHSGLRALVHAAAQELRAEGVRACLLVVDAPIDSPKTAGRLVDAGLQAGASADQADIAAAVAYLATQGDRGLSYELTVTAGGSAWIP